MNYSSFRKFGFNVYDQPPEEYFEYASFNKLRHIEININKIHPLNELFDAKRIRKLRRLADKHKIKLSIHVPFSINIADIIGAIRISNIKYLEDCIDVADKINATHITMHIGNFYWFPVHKWMRQRALHRFIKCFRDILKYCESKNVKIALENVVPIPQNSEYYLLGDNIEDFKYIFSNIDSSSLKFCLDTGHANMGEGVIPYLNNFHTKLICIHYHDNQGKNDEHLPVGKGTVPWQAFIEELENINYRGPIISECRNIKPHEAALLFQAYAEKINNTL